MSLSLLKHPAWRVRADCMRVARRRGRPAVIEIASHASGSQLLTLMFTGEHQLATSRVGPLLT